MNESLGNIYKISRKASGLTQEVAADTVAVEASPSTGNRRNKTANQICRIAGKQKCQYAISVTYSKLVKQLAGYDRRDASDTETLFMIIAFERTLFGIISNEMMTETPYKEIYRRAKQELMQLKLYWTQPVLSNANTARLIPHAEL